MKVVKKVDPDICIMENVKGILSMKHNGESVTDKILEEFSNLGYNSEFKTLNAADFGCP